MNPDAHDREQELARLIIDQAGPIIRRVIGSHARRDPAFTADDADDIASAVRLQLLRRLRAADERSDPIDDFQGYVATATYHALYDVLRRRHPERTRLRTRLRYVLTHDARFALRQQGEVDVCGLREWRSAATPASIELPPGSVTRAMLDPSRLADAVAAVFRAVGQPVQFDQLLSLLADLWGITASAAVHSAPEPAVPGEPGAEWEWRQFLESVWQHIVALLPQHRAALLLNLRELGGGSNALVLLLATGVTTFEEVAEAAGLSPGELSALWNELPLEDARIAELLGVTRAQVIGFRHSARRNLARHFPDRFR